jgi:predicted secreted protein
MSNFKLVFSDHFPEGRVMSWIDYQRYCKTLTREQFETHYTADVDAEMVEPLTDVLNDLNKQSLKAGKTGT